MKSKFTRNQLMKIYRHTQLLMFLPRWAATLILFAGSTISLADQGQPLPSQAAWGTLRWVEPYLELKITSPPPDGVISIPRLNNRIGAVYLQGDIDQRALKFVPEVSEWHITLPAEVVKQGQGTVVVELFDTPVLSEHLPPTVPQQADHSIRLRAQDAVTHGELLRFEPQPHKNTLGYWANPDDWCEWRFQLNKPGSYDVHILQGCGTDQGGSQVEVSVGRRKLEFTVQETGHFQNFQERHIGSVTFEAAGAQTLKIKPLLKKQNAVMDVRLVKLVPTDKPNIVFIFADDQCFETIRQFGHVDIDTPNLDRLARRGTTFTHTYNMGSWSGAVCIASRTMLNTGRYLWHAHEIYKTSEQERQAGRFWSEYLKAAGYDTYFSGKWHVRAKAQKAFDFSDHIRGGMPKDANRGYNRPLTDLPDTWKPWDTANGGFWQGGKHWSEVVGDDSLQFIAQAKSRDKPFFMYLAFNAPHDPRQSPQEFVERYPLDRIPIPVNYLDEYPFKDAIGCSATLRDEKLGPFPRTKHAVQVHRQEYYAIITHMDEQIGRILASLEASGKAENTYIFFTADHGLAVGHHGLFGKQNMYDHSVRVPFIAVGPEIAAGQRDATPIYLQDVMPTTLELAHLDQPQHVEFTSLLGQLHGADTTPYDAIYGAYLELQRMVTVGDYKLIAYPKAQKLRLYDLGEDPQEQNDLADQPAAQPIIRTLFTKLLELQETVGDQLNLHLAFPQL